MSIIRARQGAVTRITPHNANKNILVPGGTRQGLEPTPTTLPSVRLDLPIQAGEGIFDDGTETIPPGGVNWLGDGLAGELGALAINDAWNSTIYEYVSPYAPALAAALGTIPTPTGNPARPLSSEVNPNAADEYLVVDQAGYDAAINNAIYSKVFLANGLDVHTAGEKILTATGTQPAPRWITWWNPDSPDDVQTVEPWNLPLNQRATVNTIRTNSCDYVYFVGLSFGAIGSFICGITLSFLNESSRCIGYRCSTENNTVSAYRFQVSGGGVTGNGPSVDCSYYQCMARSSEFQAGTDVHGFAFQGSIRAAVVSCEAYDMTGDCLQIEDGNNNGPIVDDNDFYRTSATFYDGNGNQNVNGLYGNGEHGIGIKTCNATSFVDIAVIAGNRIWNMRQNDPVLTTGSTTGGLSIECATPTRAQQYMRVTQNVIEGGTGEYGINLIGDVTAPEGHESVTANLIYNYFWADGSGWAIRSSQAKSEVYQNTVKAVTNINNWFTFNADVERADWLSNVFINAGEMQSDSYLDAASNVGYGGFIGTSTPFEKNLPGTNVIAALGAINYGDFRYRRRKLSAPEVATIPGVVPTSITPAGFLNTSPGVGSADQVGLRTDIGVDDVIFGTWT